MPAVCESETSYVLQSSLNRKGPCGIPLHVRLRNLLARGTMTERCESAKLASYSSKRARLPFGLGRRWARYIQADSGSSRSRLRAIGSNRSSLPLALIPLPALISLMECPSVGEKRINVKYAYCQPE